MEIEEIRIHNKKLLAFKTILPGNEDKGEMYLIKGDLGYAMCAIMNEERVNKSGAAAFVMPAFTLEEALDCEISFVTDKGKSMGITKGMVARDGLYLLCR
ncbi:hypothetical protein EZV73_05730 [Acidaminobacter sp. JC074]|uniref:hypothetical protein n=1 Tax=Acidaminobacter sp. JC074 TaxID=2530199 RepID=UPI001F107DB4|nr:hypothetical protein [Acidaminobacter sp. JC074]MCH4887058.1 hypothetical protein [Acidaminobacter sp. JC074]